MTGLLRHRFEAERILQGLSESFQDIFDTAHEALIVLDADLRIVSANSSFYKLFNMRAQETEGCSFLGPGNNRLHAPELQALIEEVLESRKPVEQFKLEREIPGIGRRVMMINARPLHSERDKGPLVLLAIEDVTELVEAKEQLQQLITGCSWAKDELLDREQQFRVLVETMNDGLAVRDESGLLVYVNKRLCEMLGYSQGEIAGHPVTDFLDDANRNIYREQVVRRKKGLHDPYELTWMRKDGQRVDTIMSPKPILDSQGKAKGVFAVVTDITDRKRIETALRESEIKLRKLSTHLLTAHEEERERISRELHDELGQDLTVLKYQMRFIESKLRKDQRALREACQDTLQHIDDMVENIRRISRHLSPYSLKHLGLTASLRRAVEDFSKHSRTEVSLKIEDINGLLSQESEVCLYRIFQEALTNVGKHALATHLSIFISKDERSIACSLQDDGKGFNVRRARDAISPANGMGLATMEERARMIGAALEISSREGAGTTISLKIPIDKRGNA